MTTVNAQLIEQEFGLSSRHFKEFHERTLAKLKQEQSDVQLGFKAWQAEFPQPRLHATPQELEELYIRHAFLALLLTVFMARTLVPFKPRESLHDILSHSHAMLLDEKKHFNWILDDPLVMDLSLTLEKEHISFESEDLFNRLYQHLISIEERQHLGEFYTPAFLARAMIDRAWHAGQVVLDPACGSGIFLVELLKKILEELHDDKKETNRLQEESILSMHGFDVNPLAVATTRANLALILWQHRQASLIPTVISHIQRVDFLDAREPAVQALQHAVDLVIGNPPWLVLNNVPSKHVKERFKELAREFHILPPPHLVSNLEVSALFLYQAKTVLKPGGLVFFVVSNGFMAGDNHVGTRQFIEFDHVEAWKFSTDVFRIHNICLLARYVPRLRRTKAELESLHVTVKKFHLFMKSSTNSSETFQKSSTILKMVSNETYVPHSVDEIQVGTQQACQYLVRKLIPLRMRSALLPRGHSPYHPLCYNGAVISPRNLLFVKIVAKKQVNGHRYVTITPFIENSKKRWSFHPHDELGMKEVTIEERFIFQTIKSIDVVPFLVIRKCHAFLPIEPDDNTNGYRLTTDRSSAGWQYFEQLNRLYQAHQKPGATLKTLWANINYQNKLVAARQRAPIKVLIQSGGTKVKAAMVRDPRLIVDHSCFFIGLSDVQEAHYLVGILNAPCITRDVRIRQSEGAGGGGRSIKKRPLEIKIPMFNRQETLHVKIAEKAREMKAKALNVLEEWKKEEWNRLKRKNQEKLFKLRPMAIQKRIYRTLNQDFRELDDLVLQLFK